MIFKNLMKKPIIVLSYFLASLLIIVISLIRPFILIRFGKLISSRLGHFAGNTELYLCEKYSGISTRRRLCFDFFYYENKICNKQLFSMWKKNIVILPKIFSFFFFRLESLINLSLNFSQLLKVHVVKPSSNDRDIHGLLNKTPINLKFTKNEIKNGCLGLAELGIPEDAKLILLCVRDSAYLENTDNLRDWSYHNYRDSDIENYKLAAEELAKVGYYVVRMGAHVNKSLKSKNPKVIDYASNGMRSDFMDVYLASICEFVISTGNGADALPVTCFRKPCVFVNYVPILNLFNPKSHSLSITKHHFSPIKNKNLTFKEIISINVGDCLSSDCFEQKGVILIENTPEEICDISIEMSQKLSDSWKPMNIDKSLQTKFWDIFKNHKSFNDKIHHEKIKATFGSNFLRDNAWWLE